MPSWFAAIPPGLEAALARELESLGHRSKRVPGGARLEASLETGARLAATLRTPSRLLLELAEGPVSSLDALAALVRGIDWRLYLAPGAPVQLETTLRDARFRARASMDGLIEQAIQAARRGPRASTPPRQPPEPQRVRVRVEGERALVSLDAGGELLHFRGWREAGLRAPLRENLAAALLFAAGWEPGEPLLDPFCGSGTIPIEAALLAAGRPPWTRRRFAWMEWPGLAGLSPPDPSRGRSGAASIFGADKESRALAAAHDNAERARVDISWIQADIAALQPPAPTGLLLTNPPYGERLGQRVDGVYLALGRALRERFPAWRALFLCPSPALAQKVDRDATALTTFSNGGIRVGLWVVDPTRRA